MLQVIADAKSPIKPRQSMQHVLVYWTWRRDLTDRPRSANQHAQRMHATLSVATCWGSFSVSEPWCSQWARLTTRVRRKTSNTWTPLSLAGAATSLSVVATSILLSRQNTSFVATKIRHLFVGPYASGRSVSSGLTSTHPVSHGQPDTARVFRIFCFVPSWHSAAAVLHSGMAVFDPRSSQAQRVPAWRGHWTECLVWKGWKSVPDLRASVCACKRSLYKLKFQKNMGSFLCTYKIPRQL